jgi:Tol biopolymer transport system component
MKRVSILLIMVALIAGMLACGQEETDQPVIFTSGDNVIGISQVISTTGGTIEVGYNGTPIDGIQVQFPAGALTRDINVSLGYNTGTLTPNEGIYGGVALILDTGNITQFEQPVTITVPFTGTNTTPVPYYVGSGGELHPTQLMRVDRTAKTFTFETFHASLFTWILSKLISTAYAPGPEDIVDTGYLPEKDGFQVRNHGTDYNRLGECLGMTAFSLWYYMNKKSTKGEFYPKYMNITGNDSNGNPLHGQDIIATRAFISIIRVWDTYYGSTVYHESILSDEDSWASITSAILNNRRPVLLWLHSAIIGEAHSLVAYACNLLGTISVYDPNLPGQSETITYDSRTKSFANYGLFDVIALCGDVASDLPESYESILDDADANFQGSGRATINITSHTNGQEVAARDIMLTGNIQSGQVLVSTLRVFVGSTQFSTNVGYDGSFNLPVSLESGINHLQFVTEGYDRYSRLIQIPNNMTTIDFTITAKIRTIAFFSDRDGNAEIYVMNSDGSDQINITHNPGDDWDPSWSPNGKKIVFQSWRDGNAEIYVMNADGSNQLNLSNDPTEDSHPDWSPDGTKIVFSSNRHNPGGNCDIYVMNADGSNPIDLTNSSGHDWYPAWSPDGTKIAFSSNQDGDFEIYVMDADGSNLTKLTSNGNCNQPTWSPDGSLIAFTHDSWSGRHIYVMKTNGSNWQTVTTGYSEDNHDPNWFLGGKIVFASNQDGNFEIYVIDATGSNQTRLTFNSANDFHPAWGLCPG